jgi:hypothetical protein
VVVSDPTADLAQVGGVDTAPCLAEFAGRIADDDLVSTLDQAAPAPGYLRDPCRGGQSDRFDGWLWRPSGDARLGHAAPKVAPSAGDRIL